MDAYLLSFSSTFPRAGAPPIGDDQVLFPLERRIASRVDLGFGLAATAEAGRYHQPPEPADLGSVFGTSTIGLFSATHLALGDELALASRPVPADRLRQVAGRPARAHRRSRAAPGPCARS